MNRTYIKAVCRLLFRGYLKEGLEVMIYLVKVNCLISVSLDEIEKVGRYLRRLEKQNELK